MPDSVSGGPPPTNPDISLHRAGLLPAERRTRGRPDGRAGGKPFFLEGVGDGPDAAADDDFDYDDEAKFRAYRARADAAYLKYKLLAERPGPAPAGADAPAGIDPDPDGT